MTVSQEQRDAYIAEYLDNLPAHLRPDEVTRAIDIALANGFHNKWEARVLAYAVASGVGRADNPVAVAVHRLQKLSKQKAPKRDSYPVYVAEPKPPQLPDDLLAERSQVFRDILNRVITGEEASKRIAEIYERFALSQDT